MSIYGLKGNTSEVFKDNHLAGMFSPKQAGESMNK
jgi:hypothetical protein